MNLTPLRSTSLWALLFVGTSIWVGVLAPIVKASASGGCPTVSSTYPYTIIDLGIGDAYGVNDNCGAVGQNASGDAFLYASGTTQDLGTLGALAVWLMGSTAKGKWSARLPPIKAHFTPFSTQAAQCST